MTVRQGQRWQDSKGKEAGLSGTRKGPLQRSPGAALATPARGVVQPVARAAPKDTRRAIGELVRDSQRDDDAARLARAVVFALLGLCVALGAAISNVYLHRGVETSAKQPYVVQASGRELATNVDFLMFDPSKYDAVAAALKEAGFAYVRQPFSWARIEPQRGQFVWEPYDRIVGVLEAHGIQILGVLAESPAWARAPMSPQVLDAPPAQAEDFARFVGEFTRHYRGRVSYVQLWDLPNSADHWGGQPAKPEEYAALLALGFNAARLASPETKVVLAELDPGEAGNDLAFLRALYELRADAYVDVVAARVEGGTASPYDRTIRRARRNFSRAVLFRELMIEQGDTSRPIWLTHFGWNGGAGGPISEKERADYTIAAIKRARSEWPWMGLMFAWDLVPRAGEPPGYALLGPDGAPTATFQALASFGTSDTGTAAPTGFAPTEARPLRYEGAWGRQHLQIDGVDRVFRTTSEIGASVTLRFRGTSITAYLRQGPQAGVVRATLDGGPLPGWTAEGNATPIDLSYYRALDVPMLLASGLEDRVHVLTLTLEGPGDLTTGTVQLTLGGFVVARDAPLMWPVVILTTAAAVLLVLAFREVAYVVAMRAGYLQRNRGIELRPPLPHLPDWRPARWT